MLALPYIAFNPITKRNPVGKFYNQFKSKAIPCASSLPPKRFRRKTGTCFLRETDDIFPSLRSQTEPRIASKTIHLIYSTILLRVQGIRIRLSISARWRRTGPPPSRRREGANLEASAINRGFSRLRVRTEELPQAVLLSMGE